MGLAAPLLPQLPTLGRSNVPFLRLSLFIRTASLLAVLQACSTLPASESQWVQRGVTGRLVYTPDAEGDRVPDFSDVGYRGGGVSLPRVFAALQLQPVAGDDTASIQAAIDQVSALPLGADGFRGAVHLGAGEYQISGQLTINSSGVVLRGEGRGTDGTVLRATGTSQRDLIQIAGSGSQSLVGSTRQMIDKTVPVGTRGFRVDSTSSFAVGDQVRITRPSTANWISDLGMDAIPPRSDGKPITQWQAGSFDLRFDRVITRIEGDRVFVDAPLTNSFELQYGGGQIKKYNWSDRIENVGVENLRAESDFASSTDENHSWDFVTIDDAQHVWVRNTTSAHFARSSVLSHPGAKWVTVDDAINLEPKSQVTGGRRYSFDLSGQLELVTGSQASEGRHDFVNNSTRPVGPHVFHDSVASNALDESGPHQRWATGTLFDNIVVEGDQINARNRGNFGTGHGWAGANMVIWNSTANSYIVQNPPTAQNWLVGSTGEIIDDQTFGPQPAGYVDAHGSPVEIASLYEAQLADSADVTTFHWAGGQADWSDAEAWQEKLAPGGYAIETRDYLIGDIDDFTFDGTGSVDGAYIDPAWEASAQAASASPLTGFDDSAGSRSVAFTIEHQLDPDERVVHGTLAISLTDTGGNPSTEHLRLFDDQPEHQASFSDLGWDSGLQSADPFVGVVDLGSETKELQSGSVNVQLSDGAAADWAIYTIVTAKPLASPTLYDVALDGGGRTSVNAAIAGVGDLSVGGPASGELALASDGSIDLSGDYNQLSNGSLEVEIAGVGDHGSLSIGGDADLNGQLAILLVDGFMPSLGDQFDLVTLGGSLIDTFSAFEAPSLLDGLGWQTTYEAGLVSLSVVLAGDYNRDGAVDAADYTVWRDGVDSTSNLAADGNNSGVVDLADYDVWQSSFGRSAGDFSNASRVGLVPVPEPTSVLLALVAAALAATRGGFRDRPETRDLFLGVNLDA